MKNNAALRVILDIVLAVSVIFGWWYVAILLGLICLWAFPYYIEFIAAGFFYDTLYGMGRGLGIIGFAGLIMTTVVTIVFSILKLVVRWK